MKKRFYTLTLSLFVLSLCEGCFVYRYAVTPPVSGRVIDGTTKSPVEGAIVGFRKHESKIAMSAADGSFVSQVDYVWRPCFFLPGEFWPSGGQFFIEAKGYKTYEQSIMTTMGRPFAIVQPIELEKNQQ